MDPRSEPGDNSKRLEVPTTEYIQAPWQALAFAPALRRERFQMVSGLSIFGVLVQNKMESNFGTFMQPCSEKWNLGAACFGSCQVVIFDHMTRKKS